MILEPDPDAHEGYYTPPTEGDYIIPPESVKTATRTRRALEEIGATVEQIHTILAPSDPEYVSPCCGERACAVNMGMTVSAVLLIRHVLQTIDPRST
jgi:hypothetical protein